MTAKFAAIAFVLMASVSAASAKTYDCTIKTAKQNLGWIAERIILSHDESGKILVNDGLIQHYVKQPVDAVVTDDSAARIVYSWKVKIANQQPVTMMYRMSIMKADNVAMVTVRPLNYDNTFEARGTCVAS